MITAFLVDSILMVPISILLTASALAFMLCLFFLRKSKTLSEAMPKDLSVTVFDKTFNVFDVYPSPRKTLLNYVVPLFGICVYGTFVVGSFIIMKVLEMGLILSSAVFIICLASIAIGEAFEINSTANTFLDAMRTEKHLGKGDMVALLVVRGALPRISLYYLLVGIFFGSLGLSLPITFSSTFSAMTQILGRIVEFTVAGFPGFYVVPFSVAVVTVLTMIAAGKVKGRLLNLSASNPHVNTLEDFFAIAKIHARWVGHHEGFALARLHARAVEPDEIQRKEDKEQQ